MAAVVGHWLISLAVWAQTSPAPASGCKRSSTYARLQSSRVSSVHFQSGRHGSTPPVQGVRMKDPAMVAQYIEHTAARRGAVGRKAATLKRRGYSAGRRPVGLSSPIVPSCLGARRIRFAGSSRKGLPASEGDANSSLASTPARFAISTMELIFRFVGHAQSCRYRCDRHQSQAQGTPERAPAIVAGSAD